MSDVEATSILSTQELSVVLSDSHVGEIKVGANDRSFFEFNSDYVNDCDRPTLSLSFRAKNGGIIDKIEHYRMKVHPFFSNLLPEGHLREYLANRLGINKEREFYLLAALGQDLPGAVLVEPLSSPTEQDSNAPPKVDPDGEQEIDRILKFSLAGVQLKFSAIIDQTAGMTIRAIGAGGDHIVKLPSNRYEFVPESEYSSLELAKAAGINVAEAILVQTNQIDNLPNDIGRLSGESLVVKRFDRDKGKRIHIEDFAQVFNLFPDDKYKHAAYHDLARVLWQSAGEPSAVEFVRRLVFTLGIGNGDMHLKNWSLIYRDSKTPELSPGYDFVPTIAFASDRTMALSIGGEKEMRKINLDHFAKFAAKAGLPVRLVEKVVKEQVSDFQLAWAKNRDTLPFPPFVRDAIDEHLITCDLFKSGLKKMPTGPHGPTD